MLAGVSPRLSNYSIHLPSYLVRLRTHFFRLVESGRNPSQAPQNIGAVSASKLSSAPGMRAVEEVKMMTDQELLTEYNAREEAGRTALFCEAERTGEATRI